uniref:Uncharacterized protein n=1 Tax=Rhizophora mucronata TaxID=61149 RepID=A0A2P2IT08_RHIMU
MRSCGTMGTCMWFVCFYGDCKCQV